MSSLRLQPRLFGNQNLILEKLHHEAIQLHGIDAMYIPRTLIAEDTVLGEDRLSEFKDAYPIEVYLESYDGFSGQNSFASKFGLQIDSTATVVVSKRGWDLAVARYGNSILPNRPAEGDLLYIPMTKGLFEINFTDHQQPFYQLGQSYTYKLTIQLFRYASERINTGINEIDENEHVHSTDININPNTEIQRGNDAEEFKKRASDLVFNTNNPFGNL